MRMTRKDPVTPDIYEAVIARDKYLRYLRLLRLYDIEQGNEKESMDMWREASRNFCVAQTVDPLGSGPCSGRITLDHVHLHAGGTKGKRAPSDEQHLVSLCEGHHLVSKAGRIWATANRPALREYLRIIYEEGHVWEAMKKASGAVN